MSPASADTSALRAAAATAMIVDATPALRIDMRPYFPNAIKMPAALYRFPGRARKEIICRAAHGRRYYSITYRRHWLATLALGGITAVVRPEARAIQGHATPSFPAPAMPSRNDAFHRRLHKRQAPSVTVADYWPLLILLSCEKVGRRRADISRVDRREERQTYAFAIDASSAHAMPFFD